MRPHSIARLSILSVFIFIAPAAIAETLTISSVLPFAEGSGASPAVMNECQLETKLPGFIKSYGKKNVTVTTDPLEEAEGKVLFIEFTHILGTGGGGWSGPKTVSVRGELRDGEEVTGSFTATRYSTGGAFGGFKGTCSILGRCVKTLGRDIANWIKNPTMDAHLGDGG